MKTGMNSILAAVGSYVNSESPNEVYKTGLNSNVWAYLEHLPLLDTLNVPAFYILKWVSHIAFNTGETQWNLQLLSSLWLEQIKLKHT